jgi:hypothetical protein
MEVGIPISNTFHIGHFFQIPMNFALFKRF